MPQIRPIRDLKNTTAISNLCHETGEPIFITKNLGSVHYPKRLTNPFGRSLVSLDFAQKNKDKIAGGFYEYLVLSEMW